MNIKEDSSPSGSGWLGRLSVVLKTVFLLAVATQLSLVAGLAVDQLDSRGWATFAVLSNLLLISVGLVHHSCHKRLFARLKQSESDVRDQLLAAQSHIGVLNAAVKDLQREDVNTGALLRHAFVDELEREIESSRRTEVPMSLLTLEPDDLSDESSLQRLASALRERVRSSDRLAVVSKGQLAVLLHNTVIEDATVVSEGWVEWLRAERNAPVSAGLSELIAHRDDAQTFIGRSLQALEHAKEHGGTNLSVIQVNVSSDRLRVVDPQSPA